MKSKERALPLLLTALDVRKAFNVGDNEILKFRLLQAIPDLAQWNVTVDQLNSSEAKVRINGQFGPATPIKQGVGQGHSLSPLEYKIYINPLLKALRMLSVGTYSMHVPHVCGWRHPGREEPSGTANPTCAGYWLRWGQPLWHSPDKIQNRHPRRHEQGPAINRPHISTICRVPLTHLVVKRNINSHCPVTVISDKIKTGRRALYDLTGPGLQFNGSPCAFLNQEHVLSIFFDLEKAYCRTRNSRMSHV